MLPAIQNRRSIRKYHNTPVPQSAIGEILLAGCLAPSPKNRQPWRFIVTAGTDKERLLSAMERGLEREAQKPLLPGSACYLGGARHTLEIMRQAPVVILTVNVLGISFAHAPDAEERIYEICNAQSLGAAMENMTLTATELGLGSLWICDTYFAHEELKQWVGTGEEPAAALALGYAAETPPARPRKKMEEAIEWRMGDDVPSVCQ